MVGWMSDLDRQTGMCVSSSDVCYSMDVLAWVFFRSLFLSFFPSFLRRRYISYRLVSYRIEFDVDLEQKKELS